MGLNNAKDLNDYEDSFFCKVSFSLVVVFININMSWLLSDEIHIRGGIISGWGIYGFTAGAMLFNFYIIHSVARYFENKSFLHLRKTTVFKELALSPFFILFAVTLFVQWTPFFSLYPAIYIAAYICIFYFQYRFWKKMENYSESFKIDSGKN